MLYPRLQTLRNNAQLDQQAVADAIKTSPSYYGQYERGVRDIPFSRIIKLADFYGVSIDYIAGRTDNPERAK